MIHSTSPSATASLNGLIGLLKQRLHSNGKAKSTDASGNTIYVDIDIFSEETLAAFIQLSLSSFNQVPQFTYFTLEDTNVLRTFAEVLIEGAVIHALASKSLIERGREFTMADNGISFTPPSVSELMNTQYCTLLAHHWEKLKTIKARISEFKK